MNITCPYAACTKVKKIPVDFLKRARIRFFCCGDYTQCDNLKTAKEEKENGRNKNN